jgi:hypothetical protein
MNRLDEPASQLWTEPTEADGSARADLGRLLVMALAQPGTAQPLCRTRVVHVEVDNCGLAW